MQLTLSFPDDLAKKIQSIPDYEEFICETLRAAIEQRQQDNPPSKWAKIAQRIEQNPAGLGDYTEQFKKDMQLVREGFSFKDEE